MANLPSCPFQFTPYDQSQTIDNPSLVSLNYTNQEFWSLKSRMVDYIREKFGDQFNDFIEGDLAVMLLENWAFIADMLSFKMDQIANEIFIDTVTEVENAFRLSKLVGFQPQPPIAGVSMWTASLNTTIEQDLYIPSGLEVRYLNTFIELFPATSDNQPIFDQDILIPAGSLVNSSIIGIEGKTTINQFSGTGAVGQSYQCSAFPVIYDSVRVDVDGVRWTEVDYFTDSQPRQEYRVEFDSLYNAYVIFGNNRAGMIPARGANINVTFRRGGGTVGNIVTGSLSVQRPQLVEGFNYSVPVSFRNYTKGQYGYAGDGIDDIRQKLPAYLRTQNRAVTGLDYKTIADQFTTPYSGKVGKSTAVLRNAGCAANIIDIYVLATADPTISPDLVEASNELKVALMDEYAETKMLTDFVCIRDGVVILVEVTVDIVVDKFYRKFEDEFRTRIQRRVNSFFSINNWEYGQNLKESDFVKQISDITELKSIEVNFTTSDPNNSGSSVTAQFFEIIRLDQLNIAFMYD